MAGSFDEGTRELGQMIGDGKLVGKVEIDQVYALAIHSGFWRSGPLMGVTNRPRHGGETHFLTNALRDNHERYMRNLAHAALAPGGLEAAMIENVEDLARASGQRTPREEGALAVSGHPIVIDAGRIAYDRPPLVPRLSREDLKHRRDFIPRRHFGAGR